MQGKILLGALLAVLISSFMMSRGASAEVTSTSVNPLTIVRSVGETFIITVDAANVQKLWGYQYTIRYNSTVLTALNFTNLADLIYSTLKYEVHSEINNTAGTVKTSYHAEFGDHTGLSTADPKPLLQIAFEVNALGSSKIAIDPDDTRFAIADGSFLEPGYNLNTSDGYFSTEAIKLHDIAITGVTVNPTTAAPGDTISITVTFKNNGAFTENFTVTATHNTTTGIYEDIQTKAETNLAPNASDTLNFSWDTTGLAAGKYAVKVEASVANEDHPVDNISYSDAITLTGVGTAGLSRNILYIGAAIAVVILVVVVVWVLRRRK